ncbi:MAG: MASE1 domain-containing protein, partial [Rhodospirillaceae bacterium]|nr:MASE1 domain-containing protein [Rhodospirillaceae bacterium]
MRRAHAAGQAPDGRGRWLKPLAGIAAYLVIYAALDWISLIDPASPFGITPWNPPAGLSFALLLRYGTRFAPAAFVAVIAADLLFRHGLHQPSVAAAVALVIAGLYACAASLLRHKFRIASDLSGRRDLVALLGVALAAAVAVAAAVIAIYCTAGLLAWSDYFSFALRFWVGDVLGIVVLTPFLLLLAPPRQWPVLLGRARAAEYGLQFAAIALGLWIIFGLESANHFEFSYVLFLPLIWIGLRDGLVGAAWGIVATQIGLVVAIQAKGFEAATVTQFQLLML